MTPRDVTIVPCGGKYETYTGTVTIVPCGVIRCETAGGSVTICPLCA
jgi:hypothetical protein